MVIDLVFPNWTYVLMILVGVGLAGALPRLDDRSLASLVLYVFVPLLLTRYGMSQFLPTTTGAAQGAVAHQFMFIFFFLLFHSGLMIGLCGWFFSLLPVNPAWRHLYILHCVVISSYGLRTLQTLWADEVTGSIAVSAIIFLHMVVATLGGVFWGADESRWLDKVIRVIQTPFPYLLAAGLMIAFLRIELPYTVLEQIDLFTRMAVPAGLVVLGVVWGRYIHLVEWSEYTHLLPAVAWCAFFQLILSPLLALVIVPLMQLDSVELQHTLILACGAPTGLMALLVTVVYRNADERRFSVLCLVGTMLLSWLTLPWFHWITRLILPVSPS